MILVADGEFVIIAVARVCNGSAGLIQAVFFHSRLVGENYFRLLRGESVQSVKGIGSGIYVQVREYRLSHYLLRSHVFAHFLVYFFAVLPENHLVVDVAALYRQRAERGHIFVRGLCEQRSSRESLFALSVIFYSRFQYHVNVVRAVFMQVSVTVLRSAVADYESTLGAIGKLHRKCGVRRFKAVFRKVLRVALYQLVSFKLRSVLGEVAHHR